MFIYVSFQIVGGSALSAAILIGSCDVVKLLLQHGANANLVAQKLVYKSLLFLKDP